MQELFNVYKRDEQVKESHKKIPCNKARDFFLK